MDDFEPCRQLIEAARAIPTDYRVPYAFEKRIMARLAGLKPVDPLTLWGEALWRGAVFCLALAVVLAVGATFLPSQAAGNTDTLTEAVQSTVFAAVDTSTSDQIGDTP
jgi:hypothetical protein